MKNTGKRKISDFFENKNEKKVRPEGRSDENPGEGQSTSVDVQDLKCPRRKVLVDAKDEKTDGIIVAKNGNGGKSGERGGGKRRSGAMKKLEKSQMVLDCGQAVIGATSCPDCAMVYSVDDADDVKEHDKFHDEFFGRLEISKSYIDLISNFHVRDNGVYKVFYVAAFSDDSFKALIRKHLKSINTQLGYTLDDDDLWGIDKRIFLILMTVFEGNPERKMYIGGICIIEKITKAYTSTTKREVTDDGDVNDWIVGVDRIWVSSECRRRGVAMALLDAATTQDRQMEYRARRLRIAWSDPSDDGRQLAYAFQATRYRPEDRFHGDILLY